MQESQRHYKDINKLGEYVLYPFSNENFIICNILLLQPFSPFCALVTHILYKHPFDFASHLKDCVTASACSNFDIGTSVPMPMAAARAVSNICILKATSCWDFFFENKSIKAKLIVWKGSSLGRKLCLNKFFLQYIFIWMGFSSIFPRYINSISILSPKQCLARAMRERVCLHSCEWYMCFRLAEWLGIWEKLSKSSMKSTRGWVMFPALKAIEKSAVKSFHSQSRCTKVVW